MEEIKGGFYFYIFNIVDDVGELFLLEMRQIYRQFSLDLEKLNQVGSDINNVYVVIILYLVSMICSLIFNYCLR